MNNICEFVVSRKESGYIIKPNGAGIWNRIRSFLFEITGESDED